MTPEQIRDLSVKVYKTRLEAESPGAVARMLAADAEKDPSDDGKKMRNRAGSYDPLTRAYIKILIPETTVRNSDV